MQKWLSFLLHTTLTRYRSLPKYGDAADAGQSPLHSHESGFSTLVDIIVPFNLLTWKDVLLESLRLLLWKANSPWLWCQLKQSPGFSFFFICTCIHHQEWLAVFLFHANSVRVFRAIQNVLGRLPMLSRSLCTSCHRNIICSWKDRTKWAVKHSGLVYLGTVLWQSSHDFWSIQVYVSSGVIISENVKGSG